MHAARRTQAERTAGTRGAVLAAAVEEIAHAGFAEATLQAIAERAGVSKGALQYHFTSKQSLLEPVIAACVDHFRTVVRASVNEGAPPVERLRIAAHALWDARHAGTPYARAWIDLLAIATRDDHVRAVLDRLAGQAEDELAIALDGALARLGLRARVPTPQAVSLFVALLDGSSVRLGGGPLGERARNEGHAALQLLLGAALTV